MIIDAHNHPDWHKHNLNKYLENMDTYGIDITWLLSWETPEDEWTHAYVNVIPSMDPETGPIPFSRCISYAERAPERFILGYAPDPRRAYAIDKLWAAMDIYGVRVCGELKLRMMYDNPDAIKLFKFCGEKNIPVTIHMDNEFENAGDSVRPSYWYGGGIDALERALQKCPDTIILGHGPSFWSYISNDPQADTDPYPTGPVIENGRLIQLLRKYPNLYCDWSAGSGCNAIARDTEFGKSFMIEFQDRILYARDYFDNEHQILLNSMELPKDTLEKIYYKNALKLVPITNCNDIANREDNNV